MPQLVKGGKYIFGWSKVNENGKIIIPKDAYFEYKFNEDQKGILMSGSKSSGGFGLSSKRIINISPIGKMLGGYPEIVNYQLEEAKVLKIKERNFCWITIYKDKSILVPESTLKSFKIIINNNLLVGRWSRFTLAFVAKGSIYKEARNHPEIPLY